MHRKISILTTLLSLLALVTAAAGCQKSAKSRRGGSADALPVQVTDGEISYGEGMDGGGKGSGAGNGKGGGKDNGGGQGDGEGGEDAGLSRKDSLRFKKQRLLESDIARSLDLQPDEICRELGDLSCIRDVHYLALGGVDAYEKSIFTGIQTSSNTTPVVMERIALSACGKVAERDLGSAAGATIFKNLVTDTSGNLVRVDSAETRAAVDTLYRRVLKRQPTAAEVQSMLDLYEEIQAASPGNAARNWARLSCYVVLTSVEFVFY